MKLLHLSDLHIGKRVCEFSMLEDQRHILEQIAGIARDVRPDAVLIAGDLYDRSIPVGEAVTLLDDFLTELSGQAIPVFAISGNHDSPERLDFGSRIMRKNNVMIAGTFQGTVPHAVLSDRFGTVHIYLLPFLRPAAAQPFFGPEKTDTYDHAVRAALGTVPPDPGERNVLVAHQFVVSGSAEPDRCDSETVSVGGLDSVDVSAFDGFDYVALGHLHGPQQIGRPTARYAGSPLKYSFSETRQKKSVTVAELGEKGKIELTRIPLTPLRDMREIRGPIEALTAPETFEGTNREDYIRAVLTDEKEIADAAGKLRAIYPNLMRIDFENRRMDSQNTGTSASGDPSLRTPMQLFEEFYQDRNGAPMSGEEREIIGKIIEEAGRDAI
ncbi:exonuclease SbcCD subunit D [Caproiciproducens sp. NJN-50]|uniref:exonuclease SbcCD subunit D n=1 Tax=Caproiciproducens sp. NJN-50 TaxID=2507162 RepID=UPI000FFDF8E0|nr:exonuclease SbcCD subunit D [Caproiciproducens sp. NJN-50]QAT50653.1 exonuclease SbcCD subunit D [Caproiciproducens sp. NJN-50]